MQQCEFLWSLSESWRQLAVAAETSLSHVLCMREFERQRYAVGGGAMLQRDIESSNGRARTTQPDLLALLIVSTFVAAGSQSNAAV